MAKNFLMDASTTTEVLAATTDATKMVALRSALSTGTQTVSIKDPSAVEKLAGTFSGNLYNSSGTSFLPPSTLASPTGAGGLATTDWTCRVTAANGRWFQGKFGAGEAFTASATLSSAGTSLLEVVLPGSTAPGNPPAGRTVSTWMLRSTDASVAIPDWFIGIHAHRYPDNPLWITTPSPAFTYPFGMARSVDYEYVMQSNIHTAANTYNWAALDVWVDYHSAAGHEIMYTVLSTPAWSALTTYTNAWGVVGGAGQPTSMSTLGNFVTTLVTRYNTDTVRNNGGLKKLKFIECWNEPDYYPYTANIFYKDTSKSMATMCRTIYEAAKAVDPTIRILTPGIVDTAGTRSFENFDMEPQAEPNKCSKLAEGGDASGGFGPDQGWDWADEAAWHWYDYQSPATAATNALKLNKLISSMRTVFSNAGYSSTLPMHISEIGGWGWSATVPTDANKVLWILRTAMIAACRGISSISYYSHEDVAFIGAPATNSTIASAIALAHTSLAGKTARQAGILDNNSVWIEFSDGTQIVDGSAP